MVRWPDIPAVYGWLRLDRRGQWLIRGGRITNARLLSYIGRNYEHDADGCWFFQNGPQRVFVALDYTPFIYRVVNDAGAPLALETHTGAAVTAVAGAWIDQNGAALIETEHGVGLVYDLDLERLLPSFAGAAAEIVNEDELEQRMATIAEGREAELTLRVAGTSLKIAPIAARDVPQRFGFVLEPAPPPEQIDAL